MKARLKKSPYGSNNSADGARAYQSPVKNYDAMVIGDLYFSVHCHF